MHKRNQENTNTAGLIAAGLVLAVLGFLLIRPSIKAFRNDFVRYMRIRQM